MKPITDYGRFVATLPYASEIFGVYQPLIGWKARRKIHWIGQGLQVDRVRSIDQLVGIYRGDVQIDFNPDDLAILRRFEPGRLRETRPLPQNQYVLLRELAAALPPGRLPSAAEWRDLINPTRLGALLRDRVFPEVRDWGAAAIRRARSEATSRPGEAPADQAARTAREIATAEGAVRRRLDEESALAGALIDQAAGGSFKALERVFFHPTLDPAGVRDAIAHRLRAADTDPFLTFDPGRDLRRVTLSPVGIVHLFRQYFFEFDSFLGTPIGHVWLSPGSSVELIEVSTRRVLTERVVEAALETTARSETASTNQDDLSEAVRQENRDDTKLGISSTVNQSWVTGSASATASLNMDRTQQVAREQTHKRMRQQSEKLSSEIRQNYKTTFRTISEATDTTSKRYLLNNSTPNLVNYEMRRKMRQVGVQVQDIGTYLCWETFVDEPGATLGLGQLVHLAQPADLLPQPNQKEIPTPHDVVKTFQTNLVWDFPDNEPQFNDPVGFKVLTTIPLPVQPDAGYELKDPEGRLDVFLISLAGDDAQGQRYAFLGKLIGGAQLQLGVYVAQPDGLRWNQRIDFVVGGAITFKPTAATVAEVEEANSKIREDKEAAKVEDQRRASEAYVKAAKERIKLAAAIAPRPADDLREEERTVIYRALIHSLMGDEYVNLDPADAKSRHILSELINSVFDVDKMLYFVAPEWWKPRPGSGLDLGLMETTNLTSETVVGWRDVVARPANYYITEDSAPARLGSSLGWLLQLDGDPLRDAFLNAPWVKAVLPIRPRREREAIHWLQTAGIEGADGLDAAYAAPAAELDAIRAGLVAADPADPVAHHQQVTIGDAIRFLCVQVAAKHTEATSVGFFPQGADINDADKVASTPVEKVYEHGFYPLRGGFRIDPNAQPPDPRNPDPNFQVFDQWVEILPTDQAVPVAVTYDPRTGRLLDPGGATPSPGGSPP